MATLLVNDVEPRAQYTASGGQTAFSYPFAIFEDADLLVYLTPNGSTADDATDILALTTDYTVSDAGVTAGGDVTLVVAATAGDIITIVRDVSVARTSDYQSLGDLLAETLNDDLDKLVMMVQQQETSLAGRLLKFLDTVNLSGVSSDLPAPGADEILKWNSGGTALVGVKLSDIDPTAITVTSFAETLLDDATGQIHLATLDAALTNWLLTKTLIQKKGSDVASATALTLGDGNIFDITGTTTITSIATMAVGAKVTLHFDGVLILTHHATDLVLPGGANITTAAGDEA